MTVISLTLEKINANQNYNISVECEFNICNALTRIIASAIQVGYEKKNKSSKVLKNNIESASLSVGLKFDVCTI